jgi:hypothetical protein
MLLPNFLENQGCSEVIQFSNKYNKGLPINMENVFLTNDAHNFIEKKENLTQKIDDEVFGNRLGLMAKLFGCWHKNISRPFTQQNIAYRSCLDCGARKPFNPKTLKTYGNFYFPPIVEKKKFNL